MPPRSALAGLALVPVVVPAVFLLAVRIVVAPYVAAASTTTRTIDKSSTTTNNSTADNDNDPAAVNADAAMPCISLDDSVRQPDAPYVVSCERVVSKPVPVASLSSSLAPMADSPSSAVMPTAGLLNAYLCGTMEAFSWTPQGLLIRSLLPQSPAQLRRSFDTDVIRSSAYVPGDLVNGVYKVAFRGPGTPGPTASERVELIMTEIPGRPQMTVHGIVVVEVVPSTDGTTVTFVNETWLWRAVTEKPTLLESAVGRWMHWLVAGWMLFKGTKTVTGKAKTE